MRYETPELALNVQVGKLFRILLQFPEGSQLFCNHLDTCLEPIQYCLDANAKVTALTEHALYREKLDALYSNRFQEVTPSPYFERFAPQDTYHYAFAMHPFAIQFPTPENPIPDKEQVKPIMLQDQLLLWKCSEGSDRRMAARHLIGLEGLMRSVICGGYFGSVLPRRWIGRNMRYLRWWTERAALVAKIALPPEAVTASWLGKPLVHPGSFEESRELIIRPAPSGLPDKGWELYIWQRPAVFNETTPHSRSHQLKLQHAQFRYQPFVFPLESLENKDLDRCMRSYQKSDWWINSTKLQNKMILENKQHSWAGVHHAYPRGLKALKDAWFFQPSAKHEIKIKLVEDQVLQQTLKELKGQDKPLAAKALMVVRNWVQIKAGATLKMTGHSIAAKSALLDLRHREGMTQKQDGTWEFNYNQDLKRSTFADIRERIVADLLHQGLIPVMTTNDYHKMKKKERWLAIQLTPVKRVIPVVAESEENQTTDATAWETLYDDIDMDAVFPEVMALWRKRAEQMGFKTYAVVFDFQFEDVVILAAKASILNANVPGLGKTRETLFAMLLRGTKRNLIACPAKLIGEWQDEIQNTIVPYVRRQRRNWQGDILDASSQVIEWARDCMEENLCTFNIISYDKLKSTPRDGQFFRCPECGTVTYSALATYDPNQAPMLCPGDALRLNDPARKLSTCSHRVQKWKENNKEQGFRKRKVYLDMNGEIEKGIPWNHDPTEFPVERVKIIDDRPPKPVLPKMVPLDNMHKKMVTLQIGWEHDRESGEKKPILRQVERDFHVKWTFSEILRGQFGAIAADEALYFVNTETKRSQAIYHLSGPTKWPLTGTPMKGYPQDVLPLYNWAIKREAFPDYRSYDEEGNARFLEKYRTDVIIGGVPAEDGTMIGGKKKQIPKVNNPEMFQSELAPFILRHTRNEPSVIRDIPRKVVIREDIHIPMDAEHRAWYEEWLRVFAEWWAEMKAEREGKSVVKGELITKLTYLYNASSIPHRVHQNILAGEDEEGKAWCKMIKPYKGPITAKMKRCFQLVKENVLLGDKTIIFSSRQANSDAGMLWSKHAKLNAMVVDGRSSLAIKAGSHRSQRHELVQQFRNLDYHALWAGLNALAEGMNIPEANHGIILDSSWKPSEPTQAIGRMIRPAQTKVVYSKFLMHLGTIEEYMAAVSYLKARAADEGVDYMQFDDFSVTMIPDVHQYADAIVDGTEEILKAKMWSAVEHMRKMGEDEEGIGEDVEFNGEGQE